MASGSRGGYRTRSLRMRASSPDEDEVALPQLVVNLPSADLLARARSLLGVSSTHSSDDAAHVLGELERRLVEAEGRAHASDELAATMRERVKVLERGAAAARVEIRRAAETEARLRVEIDAQKHTAASHQAVLETLEQRAFEAEAQFRGASESEALLKTKIQEWEDKASTVEANHRAEIQALESRAVKAWEDKAATVEANHRAEIKALESRAIKAEADVKAADKKAKDFQVRLEAIVSEAEHAASNLEASHRSQIQALESRVTELESSLRDEMSHRDRMARHFERRLEAIASEAQHTAAGINASSTVQIECQQHLEANDVSEAQCVTNEDMAVLLSEVSECEKKVAEIDSNIHGVASEFIAEIRRQTEETENTEAIVKARIAKCQAIRATKNQQPSSPTPMPPAQTSEHRDIVDLTTSDSDDV